MNNVIAIKANAEILITLYLYHTEFILSTFLYNPIDINSYEYSFALFSLMLFKNDENGKLLELKMFEWEQLHKAE